MKRPYFREDEKVYAADPAGLEEPALMATCTLYIHAHTIVEALNAQAAASLVLAPSLIANQSTGRGEAKGNAEGTAPGKAIVDRDAALAEAEGRLRELTRLEAEKRAEWTRAENAEAELERVKAAGERLHLLSCIVFQYDCEDGDAWIPELFSEALETYRAALTPATDSHAGEREVEHYMPNAIAELELARHVVRAVEIFNTTAHDGNEESGDCDKDCEACAIEALKGHAEHIIETATEKLGTGEGEVVKMDGCFGGTEGFEKLSHAGERAAEVGGVHVAHAGCNYLAAAGTICNKCGRMVLATKPGQPFKPPAAYWPKGEPIQKPTPAPVSEKADPPDANPWATGRLTEITPAPGEGE